MITLTDIISAFSPLDGKIYPSINAWYGPHSSLDSAIQFIDNIFNQIGNNRVKGITLAVEENGTLVEYWNPTDADTFIKKYDNSSHTTPSPSKVYTLSLYSSIVCSIKGSFGDKSLNGILEGSQNFITLSTSPAHGNIESCVTQDSNYIFIGVYDYDTKEVLSETLPYSWEGNKKLELKFKDLRPSTSTTTSTEPPGELTTTTTNPPTGDTTTTTNPPEPPVTVKEATIVLKYDSRTPYILSMWDATISEKKDYYVGSTIDRKITLKFPQGAENAYIRIDSISCQDNNYKCNKVVEGELPKTIYITAGQTISITPVIEEIGGSTTTSTTTSTVDPTMPTTTTTTDPPTPSVGNNVYYGVIKEYMSPFDFRDMSINTLMSKEGTKSKSITGIAINEFTIPQDGYFNYLIIPKDKVELLYAAFTSSGLTTVFYDSTKENIPNDTNNGAFYSKYTRGGANANQGGNYNGIFYDVYFAYNASGGAPIPINIKAKNK